jgi:hypothetical protein
LKFNASMYYFMKPLIPRRVQILLRRMITRRKVAHFVNVWPIDSGAGKLPVGWKGWPDGKRFAIVLTHDVDTAKGQENCKRLADLEIQLGFRSSYNFVPKRYHVKPELRGYLVKSRFEVGVHGLYHDGKYYTSRDEFRKRALEINKYLREWNAVGFRTPSMLHNLEWIADLNIEYDASTFDTDPFEPQSDGVGTIFPFLVSAKSRNEGFVELPYTLPQDFTLFILMKEKSIAIWKRKLDWIVENGGMALVNTHPDYMNFGITKMGLEEYPAALYAEFLKYIKTRYDGQYWLELPKNVARFCKSGRIPDG